MDERHEFAEICEALHESAQWGDELTVGIARAIWRAAQKSVLLQAARRTPDSKFEFTDGVRNYIVRGDKETIDALLRWKMKQQQITEAALRRTPAAESAVRECEWHCDDPDNGTWESSCGEVWGFVDGGPTENRMMFCHRCGGKLKTAPTTNGE